MELEDGQPDAKLRLRRPRRRSPPDGTGSLLRELGQGTRGRRARRGGTSAAKMVQARAVSRQRVTWRRQDATAGAPQPKFATFILGVGRRFGVHERDLEADARSPLRAAGPGFASPRFAPFEREVERIARAIACLRSYLMRMNSPRCVVRKFYGIMRALVISLFLQCGSSLNFMRNQRGEANSQISIVDTEKKR